MGIGVWFTCPSQGLMFGVRPFSGFEAWGSVHSVGCRVKGVGFRVELTGCRVEGGGFGWTRSSRATRTTPSISGLPFSGLQSVHTNWPRFGGVAGTFAVWGLGIGIECGDRFAV